MPPDPSVPPSAPTPIHPDPATALAAFAAAAVQNHASDLHLVPGAAPRLRVDGRLRAMRTDPLPGATNEAIARATMPEPLSAAWAREGAGSRLSVDFSVDLPPHGRFRVHAFFQRLGPQVALRLVPGRIRTAEELALPPFLLDALTKDSGLILVTGRTGEGKSTTLAALIHHINQTQERHIVTAEEPVEFPHVNLRSTITQREIGRDAHSFGDALRDVLREDPDVIAIGEMRDQDTIEAALTASETGHLVLATLHTDVADGAPQRILDKTATDRQTHVRAQLAQQLRVVTNQRLVPARSGSGRIGVYEVMVNTGAIAANIRDGKTHQLRGFMQTGGDDHMVTFERALAEHVHAGQIDYWDAIARAPDPVHFADAYGSGPPARAAPLARGGYGGFAELART